MSGSRWVSSRHGYFIFFKSKDKGFSTQHLGKKEAASTKGIRVCYVACLTGWLSFRFAIAPAVKN